MADGKWLVPPSERPKLAPPPREYTSVSRLIERQINALNGLKA